MDKATAKSFYFLLHPAIGHLVPFIRRQIRVEANSKAVQRALFSKALPIFVHETYYANHKRGVVHRLCELAAPLGGSLAPRVRSLLQPGRFDKPVKVPINFDLPIYGATPPHRLHFETYPYSSDERAAIALFCFQPFIRVRDVHASEVQDAGLYTFHAALPTQICTAVGSVPRDWGAMVEALCDIPQHVVDYLIAEHEKEDTLRKKIETLEREFAAAKIALKSVQSGGGAGADEGAGGGETASGGVTRSGAPGWARRRKRWSCGRRGCASRRVVSQSADRGGEDGAARAAGDNRSDALSEHAGGTDRVRGTKGAEERLQR
ncbi:hypothetical protein B0H16DRAFT_1467358 [Mycena metata]|uniref:Uncharacterized protein n=1 Tax=Mycena metata TaxID=1033252 RepID=A0AAD7MW27_9AGAR|nr:hypothetical protein B0H16DRAFT_1467358 [Mycena metata]